MRVREATVGDVPEMHRVRMSVRENRLSDPTRVLPRHYRALLTGRGRGWVAECEGRVVGFAVVDRSRSSVWALFVEPAVEGRGVGRQLHEAMLRWAFSRMDRLGLSTEPDTRAERFYQRAGWRYVGREPTGEVRYEITREVWRGLRL